MARSIGGQVAGAKPHVPHSIAIEQPTWRPIAVCVLVKPATRVKDIVAAGDGKIKVPWSVCRCEAQCPHTVLDLRRIFEKP